MKMIPRLILLSVMASSPLWVAAQGNSDQMPMQGKGMMNQQQVEKMQENMSRMQSQMQEMHNADSQAERQRLMEQHMEAMHNHMQMMRSGMMGQGGMGKGMMGQGNMGNHQGMMGQGNMGNHQGMMGQQQGMGDAKDNKKPGKDSKDWSRADDLGYDQRFQMMERRMDHMQLMMEQMVEHQRQQNR